MKPLFKKVALLMILVCFFAVTVKADDTATESASDEEWIQYFPSSTPVDIGHHFYDQPDLFSGSSSYTYDFKLPPGTAGMAPDLKLVYRSDNENGWFGMGWELDGFAYVETRRVYPYGYILGINGSTYELVAAGNGAYHTKRESWMKINFAGGYWTVKTKNGITYKIGTRTKVAGVGNSSIRKWMVDEETDQCGNYITYSYTSSNGECYPSSITYTQNRATKLSKVKKISFSLESRSDNVMPEACWRKYRISAMQVLIDSVLVDKYTFSYSISKSSYRSLLTAIQRYGKESVAEVTKMNYSSQSGSISWRKGSFTIPIFSSAVYSKGRQYGDVNSDGLTDFIVYQTSSSGYIVSYIYYNNGNGTFSASNYTASPVEIHASDYPKLTEINGDGYVDIITIRGSNPAYINNTSGRWYSSTVWKEPTLTTPSRVDLNNDGVIDSFNGSSTYLSSPSGSGWTKCSSYTGYSIHKAVVDFNGDGYPDLLRGRSVYLNDRNGGWTFDSTWAPPTKIYSSANFRDFNGDGLIDIGDGSTATIYLNNTNGWTALSEWEYVSTVYSKFIDMNGDNLFDITYVNGKSVYLRKPDGSITTVSNIPGTNMFLYINDDPFMDVIDNTTGAVYLSNAQPDLLTKVTQPQGGTIAWTYKRVPIYSFLSNGNRRGVTFRKYVVDKITTNEGTSRTNSTFTSSYDYPTGRYERSDRMFVGFEWVKKTHPNGEYTITRFNQDIQKAGTIKAEETYTSGGKLLLKQSNNWVTGSVSGSPGYSVLLANRETYRPGTTSSTGKITYSYDSYGNVIKEEQMGEKNETGDEVTIERDYINNTTNWLIGFPYREKIIDPNLNTVLADKLIWYDGLSLGNISKGLVSEEKSWLDQFNGRSCSDSSFYSENSSRPNLGATDPHPVVKYTYDIVGNVTTKTKHNVWQDGSKDQTEAIQYDSSAYCLPVKYTNAKGHITSFTVDYVVGKPLTITDPNKGLTQYQYDSLGRVMSEFGPRDTVNPRVKYDYTNALTCKPLSQYVTVKRQTEVGATAYLTSQVYLDGFGRNWKTVKAVPESKTVIIEVAYDWNGLKTKEYLPRFSTASAVTPKITVYDSLQRVTSVTQPDGAATSYAYDGLKTTITDPRKHLTYQYHDCYDRLVKVEQVNDDGTYVTTNKYDALGRKIKVYDANYNAGVSNTPFLYVYDSLSRVRSSSDPYTGAAAYTYDLLGNTTSKTDAKRNQLIYHYDALNRLTQKSVLAPGATQTTVLTKNVYDEITAANGIGQLTSSYIGASTADGTYTYDLDGNVVKTVKNISGTAYTIQMTYDSRDRITKLTYPDAASISYTYDTDALSRVGGFATYSNWNASAMPRTVTYGNGVVTNYSYDDETLHLTDLKSQNPTNVLIQSFGYEFDQVGNITQITDNATLTAMHTKATSQSFEYDYLNRLTKSGLGMYDYDRVGNVIVKENVTFGYTDSSHPNCPTTGSNGYKASYDVNGNLIEKWDKNGVYWRYAYNTKNMLLAVYKGTEKGKEYLVEEYLYDSAGMRNQKKTYDGAAVAITRYVYLGNNVLYEAGTTKTRYILSGEREIAKVVGGTIYYTHRDHLGSSSVVTDSTGKVVNWNANYPYGENWQVSPAGTIDLDKHRFTGKETDASSGLIYFGARYYDPEVGRFISVDPAKDGVNWYAYCENNPIKYVDPNGKAFELSKAWGTTMWWLTTVDGPVPAGDAIYGLGELFAAGVDLYMLAMSSFDSNKTKGANNYHTNNSKNKNNSDNNKPKGTRNSKVKDAIKKGQQAHKNYKPGYGYKKEVRTPSGKRADAVNFEKQHVKELKPNNINAIKRGEKQAEGYVKEFQEEYGGNWTYEVETY